MPNINILGQIVPEISAQLCSDDSNSSKKNPCKFDLGHNVMIQVKFRRICRESSGQKGANITNLIFYDNTILNCVLIELYCSVRKHT